MSNNYYLYVQFAALSLLACNQCTAMIENWHNQEEEQTLAKHGEEFAIKLIEGTNYQGWQLTNPDGDSPTLKTIIVGVDKKTTQIFSLFKFIADKKGSTTLSFTNRQQSKKRYDVIIND